MRRVDGLERSREGAGTLLGAGKQVAQFAGRLTLAPGRVFPIVAFGFELIPVPGHFVDEPLEALNPGPDLREVSDLVEMETMSTQSPAGRLERLERQTQEYDLNAIIVKVATHAGISPHEIMSAAQAVVARAQVIGFDATLEEMALASGTTAAALRAKAERMVREMDTLCGQIAPCTIGEGVSSRARWRRPQRCPTTDSTMPRHLLALPCGAPLRTAGPKWRPGKPHKVLRHEHAGQTPTGPRDALRG